MKIIVDAYTAKNLGDDLFLYILFNRYKNSNVYWELIVSDYIYIDIFKAFPKVNIIVENKLQRGLHRSKIIRNKIYNREAKKYDALLIIGGSLFMQANTWEEQLKRIKERLTIYKEKNKKVYVLGSNFGPYKEVSFKDVYSEVFSLCEDVCFRDVSSYNLFKNLSNIRLGSDIVFLLPEQRKQKDKSIGISALDLSSREEFHSCYDRYIYSLKEICKSYIKEGYRIKLYSFCEAQGDLNACKKIKLAIDDDSNVDIINYSGNIEKFIEDFSKNELIISTRFHSLIISQVFGQGVYPIIYSNKTLNMLKDLGLQNYYTDLNNIETINLEELRKWIKVNNISDLSIIKKKAELQFLKLDDFINEGESNEGK